jgi:phage shock protein PspC (stress-responsive transcriptional regulator)
MRGGAGIAHNRDMPDWLRTTVLILGVLALLVVLVIGYVMWRFRLPPRGLIPGAVAPCRPWPRD